MLYGLRQTQAPLTTAVSLDEAKVQCDLRPTSTAHDTDLTLYIEAATGALQEMLNRQFVTAQYEFTTDAWKSPLALPMAPLASVEEISYLDPDNARQVWNSGSYDVFTDREPGYVLPASGEDWPTVLARPDSINVKFTAGGAEVPERFKSMILYWVRQLFEMKAPVTAVNASEVPLTLRTLIYNARTGAELQCF